MSELFAPRLPHAHVYAPLLVLGEAESLLRVAAAAPRVHARGRTHGSLEPDETAGVDYRGATIAQWPDQYDVGAAWRIYGRLGEQARKVTGRSLRFIQPGESDEPYALALNVLETGDRYELHRDTAAWNLLVFLTDHPDDGAEFNLCHPDQPEQPVVRFRPVGGIAVLFDGVTLPHYTTPNLGGRPRVVLVCQYPDPDAPAYRASEQIKHLYGSD